jgi:cytochrome b6-f complex iron-sulfur subunit
MMTTRRDFITRALYGLLLVLGLGFLVPAARIFSPTRGKAGQLVFFPLLPETELPRAGVKKAELRYPVAGKERVVRLFIVAAAEGPTILSATCSHLGCLVNYHRSKREFICPCHGGRYDLSGNNIAGPPPTPLTRFPAKIENDMVMVGIKV